MTITKNQITAWLNSCAQEYADNQDALTNLDKDIGDADHGLNMNRGFSKVAETLPTIADQNIGAIFKSVGMTLLSSVGGASGPLYGTLFIRAAGAAKGADEIELTGLIEALKVGVDGVVSRGKAELGDKTMCDVWIPVISSAKEAIDSGKCDDEVLDLMVETAEKSTLSTIEMQAKKGRASYLGERSIGHQDPGATSSLLMIKALVKVIKGNK
ncbi:dihydroxyacetone kinase ADP-binding subunit DhaL [Photobacterium leiognathi]|uniref:dihydroxyacetone kinase subunit DhaL n=1 Tax=Photobacterium leiognathi TaxID=553611 RepID=UPI001EDE0AEF|nr:dihydroxyacetone kinase subunit DhaL [Photobacterium leiognathi]MCG3884497.1 dihydroxyacetone kinase ADP-binding subunit DhaL [Photobacterium leiognathi]